jgi:hypothetical protein
MTNWREYAEEERACQSECRHGLTGGWTTDMPMQGGGSQPAGLAQPTPALPPDAHLDTANRSLTYQKKRLGAVGFCRWLGTFLIFLVLQRYSDGVQDGGMNVPSKPFHAPEESG